jgi:hypothetical protein
MENPKEAQRQGSVTAVANTRKRKPIDDHAVTGAGRDHCEAIHSSPFASSQFLFFMWGFAYGPSGCLERAFPKICIETLVKECQAVCRHTLILQSRLESTGSE